MINLIPGKKGTGKTKILVDSIKKAAENATGNVVCIERGMQLTYDLPHNVRLADADEYGITSFASFWLKLSYRTATDRSNLRSNAVNNNICQNIATVCRYCKYNIRNYKLYSAGSCNIRYSARQSCLCKRYKTDF